MSVLAHIGIAFQEKHMLYLSVLIGAGIVPGDPRGLIMGSIVDAGFAETGIAKYALLDPAAEISSLEQIFIITEYATEVNNMVPAQTEAAQTPAETQAVQETFPEGNVG